MMDPYVIYLEYMALKFHFSGTKFNYFSFFENKGYQNSKIVNPANYEKNKEIRTWCRRLSNQLTPRDFPDCIIANVLVNTKFYVHEFSFDVYKDYQKRNAAVSQTLKADLKNILECSQGKTYRQLVIDGTQEPPLLHMIYDGTISWETAAILNKYLNFTKVFDDNIGFPLLWKDARNKIIKYEPFVMRNQDETKLKNILTNNFICVISKE